MHVQGCVLTGEDRDSAEDSLADKAGDEEEGRHIGCSTAYADACSPVERNHRNEQVELNAWRERVMPAFEKCVKASKWFENVERVKTEYDFHNAELANHPNPAKPRVAGQSRRCAGAPIVPPPDGPPREPGHEMTIARGRAD